MGFFAQTGKFSGSGEYSVAEDGVYTCRLKEIETVKQPSFDDPTVMEDKYKFVFESMKEVDEKGESYRFVKFTKTGYGNDKAALTVLLDSMLQKRLTPSEYAELDLEDLTAKKWKVNVELTQNGKGNDINKILSVKPAKKTESKAAQSATQRPTPKPKDNDDDFADPFGDD